MYSDELSVHINGDKYADSWFDKRGMNLGMPREGWVEAHRNKRSKMKSVYCISQRLTLVLDMLHLRAQVQTRGILGKLRMSELFLGCSEDKSHSETRSFCSWFRGIEHRLACLKKSSQWTIFPVYLSSFHPEHQNPHLRSHSIRIPKLPEVCGSRAKGKTSPQNTHTPQAALLL